MTSGISLQVAGMVLSLLAGSGALGFFVRYGIRLAIVEKIANDAHEDSKQNGKDIAATKERVSLVEKTLQDIANSLSKLNGIDEIKANVAVLKTESQARWEAQDQRMDDLKEQLSGLREEIKQ